MQQSITGRAYVLGDNIDTDQIIPAIYLKFSTTDPEERKFFGMYAMSSVPEGQRGLPDGNIPFVRENEFRSDYTIVVRSEEHTSELQSPCNLVCRLLLEKKNKKNQKSKQ